MPNPKRIKKIKLRMWEENPNCRKCYTEMLSPLVITIGNPRQACLFRKSNRLNKLTGDFEKQARHLEGLLVCYTCSNNLSKIQEDKLPVEVLWKQSGSIPLLDKLIVEGRELINLTNSLPREFTFGAQQVAMMCAVDVMILEALYENHR
jgi:hypothetical protein